MEQGRSCSSIGGALLARTARAVAHRGTRPPCRSPGRRCRVRRWPNRCACTRPWWCRRWALQSRTGPAHTSSRTARLQGMRGACICGGHWLLLAGVWCGHEAHQEDSVLTGTIRARAVASLPPPHTAAAYQSWPRRRAGTRQGRRIRRWPGTLPGRGSTGRRRTRRPSLRWRRSPSKTRWQSVWRRRGGGGARPARGGGSKMPEWRGGRMTGWIRGCGRGIKSLWRTLGAPRPLPTKAR
jgi:hypothetical protein